MLWIIEMKVLIILLTMRKHISRIEFPSGSAFGMRGHTYVSKCTYDSKLIVL